jgi:hypothetical protein
MSDKLSKHRSGSTLNGSSPKSKQQSNDPSETYLRGVSEIKQKKSYFTLIPRGNSL